MYSSLALNKNTFEKQISHKYFLKAISRENTFFSKEKQKYLYIVWTNMYFTLYGPICTLHCMDQYVLYIVWTNM